MKTNQNKSINKQTNKKDMQTFDILHAKLCKKSDIQKQKKKKRKKSKDHALTSRKSNFTNQN